MLDRLITQLVHGSSLAGSTLLLLMPSLRFVWANRRASPADDLQVSE